MIIVNYPICRLILMYFYTRADLCLTLTALIHAALFPKHQIFTYVYLTRTVRVGDAPDHLHVV